MIIASVNNFDVLKIQKTLEKVYKTTQRSMKDIVSEAMCLAVKSAAIATKPGKALTISEMAQKYKIRPVVAMKNFTGFYFYKYFDRSGNTQVFRSINKISQGKKANNPIMAKLAIKSWGKKIGSWTYRPFWGAVKDKEAKGRRIPGAGAAKIAWYSSLPKIPGGKQFSVDFSAIGKYKKALTRVESNLNGDVPFVRVTNLVDYTATTSPGSASTGLRNADSKLRNIYLKKLENQIQRIAA